MVEFADLILQGWHHERVIYLPSLEKDRVIVVSSCDPPAQRKKVEILLNVGDVIVCLDKIEMVALYV